MHALLRRAVVVWLATSCFAAAAHAQPSRDVETALSVATNSVATESETAAADLSIAEDKARVLADQRQRAIAVATVRWLEGELHLRAGRIKEAAQRLDQGLALVEGMGGALKIRGDLLMSRGALQMESDDPVRALTNFQKAYEVFRKTGQRRSQAIALQNMAMLYHAGNDVSRAAYYLKGAGDLNPGDRFLSISISNNMGNISFSSGDFPRAKEEYSRALKLVEGRQLYAVEAKIRLNIARVQVEMGDFRAARVNIDRGMALAVKARSIGLEKHFWATAAIWALRTGNVGAAGKLIDRSFDGIDLATTTAEFRHPHRYAQEIYAASNRPRLAFAHLAALKRLDDEAAKVATTTGAALMAARFNYAEQQAHIQRLKAQEVERTAAYQRSLFISIGAATLLIILLLVIGLFTLRRSRDQVRRANVVLADTNVALEKALRAKTEFLATTSHEIRTPLNGILGMTQVMLADAELGHPLRERIGIVHGAGMTMRSLVDDILDVAKMETGNLTIEQAPLDLPATMREVARLWQDQAEAKGLAFALDLAAAPGWIVGDAGRLRQMVFNLLSNAVKFTQQGRIDVRVSAVSAAGILRLSVSDTGIGIPAAKREEVFESFRQADASTTRRFGGTGLGLTICRNLAHAMGGAITVESEEGRGACFTIELPLVSAEAPIDPGATAARADTMLLVDRNPIARSMMRALFEPRVPALRFAASVAEALALCAEHRIVCILVDEMTLKAEAVDPLSDAARLVAAAPDAFCAVLWNQADAAVREGLHAAGIDRIIAKPIGGGALVAEIVASCEHMSETACAIPLVSKAA